MSGKAEDFKIVNPRYSLPVSAFKTGVLYLAALAGLVFVISRVPRDFSMTLDETRPLAQGAAMALGGLAAWGLIGAGRAVLRRPRQIAWWVSLRLVGWAGLVASAAGVLVLVSGDNTPPTGLPVAGPLRAVEAIIPLVLAVQAALIFSPDDEPALEVMLACPRPISWLLLERLLVLFAAQAGVALAGVVISRALQPELDVPLALARWLPPAIFLAGVGVYVTLRSRVAAFGATVAGMVWFVFALFGRGLMPGVPTFWPLTLLQPFIWAFNPYLQPEDVPTADYNLNRVIVLSIGVLLLVAAVRWLRDEERVMGGARPASGGKSS